MEEHPQAADETPAPALDISPAPHIWAGYLSTRGLMLDVVIAMAPLVGVALWVFGLLAAKQLLICVGTCLLAEAVFTAMRGRRATLLDFSASVTGLILALSLPATAPWYVGAIGSVTAIGLGKVIFGGLGQNIFNPAMVGRAFVMIAFASSMGASAYVAANADVPGAVTQATPLTQVKMHEPVTAGLWDLLAGTHNGSLGEVSALACLAGGLYLCIRRTASWEIPVGVLSAVAAIAGAWQLGHPQESWTMLHHVISGAVLFGAFFIATDPVSSPLTPKGKFIFGLGVGSLVMVLRLFSGYPEGVMFAILLMNAVVPLINRWTIPKPVGGAVPVRK